MLRPLLIRNKFSTPNTKLLVYKALLKPIGRMDLNYDVRQKYVTLIEFKRPKYITPMTILLSTLYF